MSTKTLGWLVRARDGKKFGSGWDPVNYIPTLSQPGLFQTFATIYPEMLIYYWMTGFLISSEVIAAVYTIQWVCLARTWNQHRKGLLPTGLPLLFECVF